MAQELMKAPRIRLHFNVHEPVELVEMTLAFQGLGHEYQSFIREQTTTTGERRNISDVKLYITKIESNCILAELAPALTMLGALSPIFADANNVADFVRNTGALIDWLRRIAAKDDIAADEIPHSKRKLNNIRDIVRLVAKNKDSGLGLKAVRYEEDTGEDHTVLELDFTDKECKEAESGATKALQALDAREKADYEKVLMYFYQTNTENPKSTGRTGDKAIIDSISEDPLRVYIISDVDQQKIRYVLDDKDHNPLYTGFVVDVNIEKDPKGRLRIYRVLRVHDVIHDDD